MSVTETLKGPAAPPPPTATPAPDATEGGKPVEALADLLPGRDPLLTAEGLRVWYKVPGKGAFARPHDLKAVDGISLAIGVGETLGVVGESGCGKSTLGRALIRLVPDQALRAGRIQFQGRDITRLSAAEMRPLRRDLQIVFQDPLASLDPRMTAGDIIAEPLRSFAPNLSGAARRERVADIMAAVGLRPEHVNRYPHEFSGGQCQRIGIARAIVAGPKLVVCDEPVSSLDVSIRAQIINLLMEVRQRTEVSLMFISHDLSVVRHISDRVLVLYLGRTMEVAPAAELFARPQHPYTRALLSAVPIPDPERERAKPRVHLASDDLPSPTNPPTGCVFRTRCPKAQAICAAEVPMPLPRGTHADHLTACHFPEAA